MTSPTRITSFVNDGLEFDVIDTGPIDGEIVVLLHGWPQTAKCWAEVSQRLNALGYRTVMPTQRGYSKHARPTGVWAYRMGRLVSDIRTLIVLLGAGPVHLVGHDWGAAVAWAFAASHPEHTRSLTSLSVPSGGAFLQSTLSSDQLLRSYYMALFQIPRLPDWAARHYRTWFSGLLRKGGMTEAQVQEVYADIIDDGALPTSLNWYRAMFLVSPLKMRSKVAAPTTHIWSDRDVALSRRSAELAEKYTTGPFRLEIVEGATHWMPEQNAELIAKLINESIERARHS